MIPPCAIFLFDHYTGVWRIEYLFVTIVRTSLGCASAFTPYSSEAVGSYPNRGVLRGGWELTCLTMFLGMFMHGAAL